MEPANERRLPFGERLFSVLWLIACAGVIAVCVRLVVEENLRVTSVQAVGEYLQQNEPQFTAAEVYSRLLNNLAGLRQRAALVLTTEERIDIDQLLKRYESVAIGYGEDAKQLAREFAALSAQKPVEAPAASFSAFNRCPHLLVFTSARSYQREPRYSFRIDYSGEAFPSENFQDLRRGDVVAGWRIRGATTRKVRGLLVERAEKDRKGRVKRWREKMPDFDIYRLSLTRPGMPDTVLTLPASERDGASARLSRFEFVSTLSGETPSAQIALLGLGGPPNGFEVKVGSEFVALGKGYRVVSVNPSALHLEELDGGNKVIWELGNRYE